VDAQAGAVRLATAGDAGLDARSRTPFGFEPASSNQTRRRMWTWYPLLDWTHRQVWNNIHRTGLPYHPVYGLRMRRLSCALCPLAARDDIVRSCQLLPAKGLQIINTLSWCRLGR
jgi:3'-phosphoadenosine 5'-phosphosulfate sulfotransferase (PAPS reductase)/FAD synthetase